jgi:hypothetical protein
MFGKINHRIWVPGFRASSGNPKKKRERGSRTESLPVCARTKYIPSRFNQKFNKPQTEWNTGISMQQHCKNESWYLICQCRTYLWGASLYMRLPNEERARYRKRQVTCASGYQAGLKCSLRFHFIFMLCMTSRMLGYNKMKTKRICTRALDTPIPS